MEIHNHGNNLKPHVPAAQNGQAKTPAGAPGQNAQQTDAPNEQHLLEKLRSGDALRQQLLVEIQAKIQAGEYQTRAAALKAAEQIVGE